MIGKKGLSSAYLSLIILSSVFSIGTGYVLGSIIDFNLNEDISKSFRLSLNVQSVAVTGVTDSEVTKGEDYFALKALLKPNSNPVPFEDIMFVIEGDDFSQTYYYNGTNSFDIYQLLVSDEDNVLRPGDKVEFMVPTPKTFEGGENLELSVGRVSEEEKKKLFLKLPFDLYGNYMILR